MNPDRDPLVFLAVRDEMGGRTRAFDWSETPVGPAAGWPRSLKTAVRIMLDARYPMSVWWGRGLTYFSNDAYAPFLGTRHPDALGRPASEVWSEVWSTSTPLSDAVMDEGRATLMEELPLVLERNGFPEETYFTFSYSPLPDDDGGVGGVLTVATEDTRRVLDRRRLRTLRSLAERATRARTAVGACEVAAETLAENPHDLPFALLYLLDGDGRRARLSGLTGLDRDSPACPADVALDGADAPWPFRRAAEAGGPVEVVDLTERFGTPPGGAWPESPNRAVVLPMTGPGQAEPAGFVVAGVSPRLAFGDDYKGFMDLLAGHVATAVGNARADAEERGRAEQRTRTILDSITDCFFALGHDWTLTYVNRAAEQLLGRIPGDLLGRDFWRSFPGLAGSEFERVCRRTMAEGVPLALLDHYPDRDRWYEVNTYPTPDGMSIYFRNVTERRRAGEEIARLAAEAERERRLLDTALRSGWTSGGSRRPCGPGSIAKPTAGPSGTPPSGRASTACPCSSSADAPSPACRIGRRWNRRSAKKWRSSAVANPRRGRPEAPRP